jgi:hypothetical protein
MIKIISLLFFTVFSLQAMHDETTQNDVQSTGRSVQESELSELTSRVEKGEAVDEAIQAVQHALTSKNANVILAAFYCLQELARGGHAVEVVVKACKDFILFEKANEYRCAHAYALKAIKSLAMQGIALNEAFELAQKSIPSKLFSEQQLALEVFQVLIPQRESLTSDFIEIALISARECINANEGSIFLYANRVIEKANELIDEIEAIKRASALMVPSNEEKITVGGSWLEQQRALEIFQGLIPHGKLLTGNFIGTVLNFARK